MIFRRQKKLQFKELYPDEVFLDSSNLPKFNLHQFEGRLEKPINKRAAYLTFFTFLFVSIIFVGQATRLQVVKGQEYLNISLNNHLQLTPIFADRGVIYDRNMVPIAWNVVPEEPSDFTLRRYIDMGGFGHLLGYVNYPAKDRSNIYYRAEFVGRGGLEQQFNSELSGEHGIRITERNALMEVVSQSVQRPPKDGAPLETSIDSRIQTKLYDTISKTANSVKFRGGSGIIMNVKTGEIIAMTSYPEYRPQTFTDGDDSAEIERTLNNPVEPFLDRAVAGLFTPGSIVKPFMAMAALSEEIISPEKKILSTGALRIPNPYFPGRYAVFNDWKAHGWVDMRRALAVSSNVYFFTIGGGFQDQKGLGIRNIEKYSRMFGMGERTGINFPGDRDGIIPNPEWKEAHFEDGLWRIGDTYNTSIGQYGFQVTPLQMVRAVAGIANNGELPTPTILKTNRRAKMEMVPLKAEDFKVVQEGMRLGALEGTAAGLSVAYTKVAAKTGTAEIGANNAYVNSWVMGYFPYENPEYAFVVLMERGPRANLVGGVSVMRQVLDFMRFNTPEYFGLAKNPDPSPIHRPDPLPTPPQNTEPQAPEPTYPITQPSEVEPAPELIYPESNTPTAPAGESGTISPTPTPVIP
jgi:penicillin-binding protein 2